MKIPLNVNDGIKIYNSNSFIMYLSAEVKYCGTDDVEHGCCHIMRTFQTSDSSQVSIIFHIINCHVRVSA